MTDETELTPTQELHLMDEATQDDGAFEVTIDEWEKGGNTVDIRFTGPTGQSHTQTMNWPKPPISDDNKFVRIVREAGYNMSTADMIEGETVLAERGRHEMPKLVAEKQQTLFDRIKNFMLGRNFNHESLVHVVFVAIAWPVYFLVSVPMMHLDENEPRITFDDDYERYARFLMYESWGIFLGIALYLVIYYFFFI